MWQNIQLNEVIIHGLCFHEKNPTGYTVLHIVYLFILCMTTIASFLKKNVYVIRNSENQKSLIEAEKNENIA